MEILDEQPLLDRHRLQRVPRVEHLEQRADARPVVDSPIGELFGVRFDDDVVDGPSHIMQHVGDHADKFHHGRSS